MGAKTLASPVARRLLKDYGLDPAAVRATGTGGRITRNDVYDAATEHRAAASVVAGDTNPHAYTATEVDYERVERARRSMAARWRARESFSLTHLPFVARAVCSAIREFPKLNACVDGDRVVAQQDVNIAIADAPDGTPAHVIRNVDGKRLRLIARELHDLETRTERSRPAGGVDATFALANPGRCGTYMTLPAATGRQVAIVSTDAVRKRPAVVTNPEDERSLAIRHEGIVTLTWDQRACDLYYAAGFLESLRAVIETREWEAEIR